MGDMCDTKAEGFSAVEKKYGYTGERLPGENIGVLVVDNFPELGRLTALRFIEWVQGNPGGVISLPTGKTPEHFIGWVKRILAGWNTPEIRSFLEEAGINPAIRPQMDSLYFVQIDEFYPISPRQHNSFYNYVCEYYLKGFGLDPKKALLLNCEEIGLDQGQTLESVWPEMTVDLSLRLRSTTSRIEEKQQKTLTRIDQFCQEYEQRIRSLGGIGFFLGGIGPDGHVGFNCRGSDHFSTTRLCPTNYETQAAAATDLGGIEISRQRLVITIGLGTITHNPSCTALIMAAGEAKKKVVADAISSLPDVRYPGTSLHKLPNARFYLTGGAAAGLTSRTLAGFRLRETLSPEDVEKAVVDLCVRLRKPVRDLQAEDFAADSFCADLPRRTNQSLQTIRNRVTSSLIQKIEGGMSAHENTTFLHTEPHHDDLMLGYLPAIVRNIRSASNHHHFTTLTSGFTAVTNAYMMRRLAALETFITSAHCARLWEEGYFQPTSLPGRNRDLWQYLDGIAEQKQSAQDEGAARRMLRDLCEVFGGSLSEICGKLTELGNYFRTNYPGKKDRPDIQKLKGMCREWEVECLWGYFGWNCENISHLRLGFYTGDVFTEEPTENRDVPPVLDLIRKVKPDILSVAFDPEASGPDTHYKVMQAVNAAIGQYGKETDTSKMKIWGYRNVWYRFHPSEANVFVPVSLNMFSVLESAFLNTFISQKEASFPSYEYDGPFCGLAREIQVEQYQTIKTCLGREWFQEHPSALIRATRGLVYLKEMSVADFTQHSRALRKAAENR